MLTGLGLVALQSLGFGVGAIVLIAVIIIAGFLLASAVKILREYERGVVFRRGRLQGARGPGRRLLVPRIDRMVRVELRTVTMDVPPQDVIARANVPARVTAVIY